MIASCSGSWWLGAGGVTTPALRRSEFFQVQAQRFGLFVCSPYLAGLAAHGSLLFGKEGLSYSVRGGQQVAGTLVVLVFHLKPSIRANSIPPVSANASITYLNLAPDCAASGSASPARRGPPAPAAAPSLSVPCA